jgi:lipase maturation factor 1
MDPPRQVGNVPGRPVMLYDADCRFCVLWIRRWMQITGNRVECVPLQDGSVPQLYPEVSRDRLEAAVHFIDTDGVVYRGAEAVFRSLATNSAYRLALRLYQGSPQTARISEACYRFIAGHRTLFSLLTRWLWGSHVERPEYFRVRRLFLVCLGMIYLSAFLSLWVQTAGLLGKNGILPAGELMSQAGRALTDRGVGVERYHLLPTLCWLGASDGFLKWQCGIGAALALGLIAGIAPRVCLAGMWLLYLSLTTAGGEFLSFQWDNLLLETGLLAVFFAPGQILPWVSRERPPSRAALWLLRLLLFKLMFLSGVVKLASGDQAWRHLTALTRHYETQPLPTWIGWYAHQLPEWFQRASCAVMFAIELAVPFLIFAPRRLRMAGGAALALFQVLILLTGNYTFFNWLTLALCLLLLDDFVLGPRWPAWLARIYSPPASLSPARPNRLSRWSFVALAPLALLYIAISAIQVASPFGRLLGWVAPIVTAQRWLGPFRSVNSYGLFAVMTMERPEILVEGSNDGRTWQEYGFPYKPGDLNRRPQFVAPYQPRLDWQMWFAALGTYRQNPWFISFCVRLLQGSPEVLALLTHNPFPGEPPKYIRARLYDYHFTTREERRHTGAWWKREFKGEYLPPISLDLFRSRPDQRAEL